MDLVTKLVECAEYSKNRAQVAEANLCRIRSGSKPVKTFHGENLLNATFLPPKAKETTPNIMPIPRKWAPLEKIVDILDVPNAFDEIKCDPVESIRERHGLI